MSEQAASKLAVFEGKRIRKVLFEGEWWFSIIDVVEVLVGGDRPRKYWNDLKQKLATEGYVEVSEKIGQLKIPAPDGKQRFTDCANTEKMFRIIQSKDIEAQTDKPVISADNFKQLSARKPKKLKAAED
jgi:DNA-damage-inducible protein D